MKYKQYFRIMYPVQNKNSNKHWIRIGSATQNEKGIACTIEAIPINWDGTFFLFLAQDGEEKET